MADCKGQPSAHATDRCSDAVELALEIGVATIEVLQEPGFLDNVKARGDQLIDALREMQQLDQALLHVRGRGLMVATEFATAERAQAIVDHCFREHNVILMIAGTFRRVIRWSPPLIVTQAEIDEALSAFSSAIRATG